MSKLTATSLRRTGTVTSPIRQIVVVQGTGRDAVERILSTPIEKIQWGVEFRHGAAPAPMEQYAFRVGKTVVERFADATALVMKKHHVVLEPGTHQEYVVVAQDILKSLKPLRVITPPSDAVPATGAISQSKVERVVTETQMADLDTEDTAEEATAE